jgi:hypothetical protein
MVTKGTGKGRQQSIWRRISRNKSQAFVYFLGLLVVLSMILSLLIGALPPPEPPTPTPASWSTDAVEASAVAWALDVWANSPPGA